MNGLSVDITSRYATCPPHARDERAAGDVDARGRSGGHAARRQVRCLCRRHEEPHRIWPRHARCRSRKRRGQRASSAESRRWPSLAGYRHGQEVAAWEQQVLPFEFTAPPSKESTLMFFSRCQTEQTGTAEMHGGRWAAIRGRRPVAVDRPCSSRPTWRSPGSWARTSSTAKAATHSSMCPREMSRPWVHLMEPPRQSHDTLSHRRRRRHPSPASGCELFSSAPTNPVARAPP